MFEDELKDKISQLKKKKKDGEDIQAEVTYKDEARKERFHPVRRMKKPHVPAT